MEAMARPSRAIRIPLRVCAKLLGALACCTVLALGLFALSLGLLFRNFNPLGGGPTTTGPLDLLGFVLLPSPFVVFALGARLMQTVVRREIPRRWQDLVLWTFTLFPIPLALLVQPSYEGYELVRRWVTAERQRHEETTRLEAAQVAAFGAAPIQAEVLQARLLEARAAPDYGGGTLELTIRVRNAPPVVPHYHLTVLDLAQHVVSGRAHSRLPVEPPYRTEWTPRGASGHVTVRNVHGRWTFVEDGTSRVLDSGPDTFTTRLRYFERVPGLGPPRGVVLYLSAAEDGAADHLYLAAPFPPPS